MPSQSSQHASFPPPVEPHIRPSNSSISLAYPQPGAVPGTRGHIRSSRTWTSSSRDAQQSFPEAPEEEEDRAHFAQEYNRLAKKHGLRTLTVDEVVSSPSPSNAGEKRHWFSRMLRSTSRELPAPPEAPEPPPFTKSKRSISDLAYHLVNTRTEVSKYVDLQSMVRLSGKCILYLPPEFTPGSLILPTCLRATAQHLVQHAATRGIFRIPGSSRVVGTLFEYYCFTGPIDADVASTVRCANLPLHIQSSVHDVASTFKRFLSVLPGGILGSLTTFDALVAVNSQLRGDPEFPRTKQTKLRSRLIALIINTTSSQLQRNLICAVFGLLSLIGRIAENAPREDDRGRPLPTSDLMGYSALGIVFGPLLVGNLLDQYTMKLATPSAGLMLLPLSPHKIRHRRKPESLPGGIKGAMAPTVNKILVANDVVQMIIMNWRDIVRQLGSLAKGSVRDIVTAPHTGSFRGSLSKSERNRQPRVVSSHEQQTTHGSDRALTPGYEATIRRPKSRATWIRPERNSNTKPNSRPTNVVVLSPTLEESFVSRHRLPGDISEAEWQQLQEIGNTLPRTNTEFVTPTKRNLRETTSDSQRLSSGNVPPRTSSKRESPSPKPTFPENRSPSPQGRGHTSTDTESDQHRKSSRLSRSRSASSRRVERWSKHIESNQQTGSAPHSVYKGPCCELERSKAYEDETVEAQSPRYGPEVGDVGDRLPWSQEAYPKASQKPFEEAHRSPLSNLVNEERAQSSEPQRASTDANIRVPAAPITEGTCSPMRVPPGLIAPTPEANNARSQAEGWNLLNKVTWNGNGKSLAEKPGSVKTPERLAHSNRSFMVSATSTADSQANIHKEADKGDPKHQSKPPPSKNISDPAPAGPKTTTGLTEAVIQRRSVRAMAAKFDATTVSKTSPGSKQESMQKRQQHIDSGSDLRTKTLRSSKSGPLLNAPKLQRGFWANPLKVPPKDNQADAKELRDHPVPGSVAQRAAAIMTAESLAFNTLGANKEPSNLAKQPILLSQDGNAGDARTFGRQAPSLGTMTPHQEEPPIAQHINFSRPASVISVVGPDVDPLQIPEDMVPTSRSGATSVLHHQIRTLQKQLDLKTEEAAQLRRQLEAQGTSEIGTLSEQLREAKREARMWKDRADAAERRVQVFKRFTARLKGIREAATAADEHQILVTQSDDDASGEDTGKDTSSSGTEPSENPLEQPPKGEEAESNGSDSSGVTEDAGVMTARIRKCLHGSRRSKEKTQESVASVQEGDLGADGATNVANNARANSGSITDAWLAAKGFLDNEDE